MSRHGINKSTDHRIKMIGPDHYRLSWVVDYYYAGSMLRYPRAFRRDTDYAGAVRFAKRWKREMPASPEAPKGPR